MAALALLLPLPPPTGLPGFFTPAPVALALGVAVLDVAGAIMTLCGLNDACFGRCVWVEVIRKTKFDLGEVWEMYEGRARAAR